MSEPRDMSLMTTERTPGPWESVWDAPEGERGQSTEPGEEWGIRSADGTVVVGTFWHDGMYLFMREEDARLIAASPDLLASLEALLDQLTVDDLRGRLRIAVHTAEQAIKRAKGEA